MRPQLMSTHFFLMWLFPFIPALTGSQPARQAASNPPPTPLPSLLRVPAGCVLLCPPSTRAGAALSTDPKPSWALRAAALPRLLHPVGPGCAQARGIQALI